MSYLSNKKILLTGAAGGFGTEYIRQLLHKGAHLILSDIDEEMVADKASSISGVQGRTLGCIGANLASPAGCQSLYSKAVEKVGDIDIVIHNAGILTYGYYHDAPVERLYQLMQVNTVAPMHLTSLFLPGMLRRGSGHLVFMSSVAGFAPTSFETAYSTSKFALRGFGMALSGELSKRGIAVTNIYPFWADTNILNSPSYGQKRAKRVPSFMIDSPEKIIGAAIRGIERQKRHVYPGFFARATWWLTKLWPIIGRQPTQEELQPKNV